MDSSQTHVHPRLACGAAVPAASRRRVEFRNSLWRGYDCLGRVSGPAGPEWLPMTSERARTWIDRGWLLHLITLLGRELPAERLFGDVELLMLNDFARQRSRPRSSDLRQAAQLVAVMV